jgi:membrane protease YdiL (CAAX protease family)
METEPGYLSATRHPWSCLLFLLPLLLAYEGGVLSLGGPRADALRNGVDAWLRLGLSKVGLKQTFVVPVVLAAAFLFWCWRRRADRPKDLLGVVAGMALESVVFALGLWGLSRGVGHLMDRAGVACLSVRTDEAISLVVTYIGAGVYEEVVFRLVLFSGMYAVLKLVQAPGLLAVAVAALASAACFSAAHHVGPYGETFESTTFIFRLVAGVYFALVFQTRGLGVAAGAHACYDVLAGISVGP